MRKNKKVSKKMSVVANRSAQIGSVMLALFLTVLVNLLANSSCAQLMKSIGEKEREIARLGDEYARESEKWEEMKSPANLERALLRHGLAMSYNREDQIVRMKSNGKPYEGQISIAKIRNRKSGQQVAQAGKRRR